MCEPKPSGLTLDEMAVLLTCVDWGGGLDQKAISIYLGSYLGEQSPMHDPDKADAMLDRLVELGYFRRDPGTARDRYVLTDAARQLLGHCLPLVWVTHWYIRNLARLGRADIYGYGQYLGLATEHHTIPSEAHVSWEDGVGSTPVCVFTLRQERGETYEELKARAKAHAVELGIRHTDWQEVLKQPQAGDQPREEEA